MKFLKAFPTVVISSLLTFLTAAALKADQKAAYTPLKLNVEKRHNNSVAHYDDLTQEIPKSIVHIEKQTLLAPGQGSAQATTRERKHEVLEGTIVSADGYILTYMPRSDFFDTAENDLIFVTLTEGQRLPAQYKGQDPTTQIALLKIDASNLPSIVQGNSTELKAGDMAFNIFWKDNKWEVHQSVIAENQDGVVACQGSLAEAYPLGSPLLNLGGNLIGICSSSQKGTYIPVNVCRSAMLKVLEHTEGEPSKWVGFSCQVLKPEVADFFKVGAKHGVLINKVTQGSLADNAGVKAGDVLVRINADATSNPQQVAKLLAQLPASTDVTLQLIRQGAIMEVALPRSCQKLALAPASSAKASVQGLYLLQGVCFKDHCCGKDASDTHRVVVSSLDPGSPFMKHFHEGMGIVQVNGQAVTCLADLQSMLQPGNKNLFLTCYKGGHKYFNLALN